MSESTRVSSLSGEHVSTRVVGGLMCSLARCLGTFHSCDFVPVEALRATLLQPFRPQAFEEMADDPLIEFRHVLRHMAATLDSGMQVNLCDMSRRAQNALRAAGAAGTLRLPHATEVMELLRATAFTTGDKRAMIVLANTLVRERPQTIRVAQGGVSQQSCHQFHLYADESVWNAFGDIDVTWGEALNVVANRCMQLGLTNPNEPTARAIVATYVCRRAPSSSMPFVDANDGLEKKREVMQIIKEAAACGLGQHVGEVINYPDSIMEFQQRHPAVFASAFPNGRAIPSPLDRNVVAYVVRRLPCRSSSGLVAVKNPAQPARAHHDRREEWPTAGSGFPGLPGFRLLAGTGFENSSKSRRDA